MQLDYNDRSAQTVRILSYAGLLPFVMLLLISIASDNHLSAQAAWYLRIYATVILTFVGAVHWGCVLAAPENTADEQRRLYWAVTPSLVGWLALTLAEKPALAVLIAAFGLCWWIDRTLYQSVRSDWYLALRDHLTAGVVGTLVALLLFG